MGRGACLDTALSDVYRSVDTPPSGEPSVSESVVTSVTRTSVSFKTGTGIQKERLQGGEVRALRLND